MKCYVSSHDPVIAVVYLPDEAVEMFGQDMLDEFGTEIPDELALEYKLTYDRLMTLSTEIERIRTEQLHLRNK